MNNKYEKFRALKREIADLNNSLGVLNWDQEVNMPPKGAGFRAQQIATLSGLIHEKTTAAELEDLMVSLSSDDSLSFVEKRNVTESLRFLRKLKALPVEFVRRESRVESEAYEAWVKARQEDSFEVFQPHLKQVVDIQIEKTNLVGYTDHPYDVLLDDYEPGVKTAELNVLFDDVRKNLAVFFEKIKGAPSPVDTFFNGTFPQEKQLELCRQIVADMGFSKETGRLDLSIHPFSTSFNPLDVRITTRVNECDLRESIWGSIHETGHALYELGLPESEYGLPSGSPTSLGIHESQSRIWENNIGKSQAFINAYHHDFARYFPQAFEGLSAENFFKGLNAVKPDLIRINSDEVTYHFHILLRFELEKGLIEGSLEVKYLENAWNEKIKTYLGLDVPSPKFGVLQDIHWSHGSFGYFPTYSLGSFYAAQFHYFAGKAIPELEHQVTKKQFRPFREWLRENIHSKGDTYPSNELCKVVTGENLDYKYFDDYLNKKYSAVYSLSLN